MSAIFNAEITVNLYSRYCEASPKPRPFNCCENLFYELFTANLLAPCDQKRKRIDANETMTSNNGIYLCLSSTSRSPNIHSFIYLHCTHTIYQREIFVVNVKSHTFHSIVTMSGAYRIQHTLCRQIWIALLVCRDLHREHYLHLTHRFRLFIWRQVFSLYTLYLPYTYARSLSHSRRTLEHASI